MKCFPSDLAEFKGHTMTNRQSVFTCYTHAEFGHEQ